MQLRRATGAFSSSLLLVILSEIAAPSAELRLAVDGIRSDSGDFLVALYDSSDGLRSAIANATTRGPKLDSGRLIGTAITARRHTEHGFHTVPARLIRYDRDP
jgi:uncharacterized protein (DUF2141 family)